MPTLAPLDIGEHCVFAGFLHETPIFAASDGNVHRLDNGHKIHEAHDGLLAAKRSIDGKYLITSGEDGTVIKHLFDGTVEELASIGDMKWINYVANGPQGANAFAHGKNAHIILSDGTERTIEEDRTVEAIAFAPKGLRVALARYNGVSLHWVNNQTPPIELLWDGAHLDVTFSPNGKFLVTSMQENALHGWKLDSKNNSDERHMRMTGYPAKVKSWSWSKGGKWLATSGAPAAIVWPFSGKDGPMGKAPLELGTRGDTMVTQVACHPQEDVIAIGYGDGMILAARFEEEGEAVLRRGGNAPISSMNWHENGRLLSFGSESGECGLIDIAG